MCDIQGYRAKKGAFINWSKKLAEKMIDTQKFVKKIAVRSVTQSTNKRE